MVLTDLAPIHVHNERGECVEASPVYSMSIGAPHVADDGDVAPPVIILCNGGNGTEMEHLGVYFALSDPNNMREIAQSLLVAAKDYEALMAGKPVAGEPEKYSADWVKRELIGIVWAPLRKCSICAVDIGYMIQGDTVQFSSACDCTTYDTPMRPASFEEIAKTLQMQDTNEVRDRIVATLKGDRQ